MINEVTKLKIQYLSNKGYTNIKIPVRQSGITKIKFEQPFTGIAK